MWLETSRPKLKQALLPAATTQVQASSDIGPPLGVFMVSCQRYEGDISIREEMLFIGIQMEDQV